MTAATCSTRPSFARSAGTTRSAGTKVSPRRCAGTPTTATGGSRSAAAPRSTKPLGVARGGRGRPAGLPASDDGDLVLPPGKVEHRADEVAPARAEEPGAAHDPALEHLALAGELRPAVDRERVRLVRLDVRLALRPVEDVVGREIDNRRAERDHVARAGDVDRLRPGRVRLRPVHVGPGRRVEDQVTLCYLVKRTRDVPVGAGQ